MPLSLKRNEGSLHDLGEDTRQQGQPKREDFVLICTPFECKAKIWSVSREDQDIKVLQVDRCKPIEVTNALKDAFLQQIH